MTTPFRSFLAAGLLVSGTFGPAFAWQIEIPAPPSDAPFRPLNITQSIAVDPDDDVIVGGRLAVPAGVAAAHEDLGVVKLSGADGSEIWRKTIDSGRSGRGTAKVDPNGDVIVVGSVTNLDAGSTTDILAVKLAAATGDVIWTRRINGTANDGDVAGGFDIDGSGDVVLTGRIRNATGPASAMLVVKLAAGSGNELWRREITSGVAEDDAALDNGGSAARFDGNGDVIAAGTIDAFPFDRVALVVKLKGGDGDEVWRNVDASANVEAFVNDLALDAAGNAVITGSINGSLYYAKVSKDGAALWDVFGNDTGTGHALVVDAAGSAYVAGEFRFPNPNGGFLAVRQFVVVKVAGDTGAAVWTYVAPTIGIANTANAVVLDRDQNVVATGGTALNKKTAGMDLQVVKLANQTGAPIARRVFDADEGTAVAVDSANDLVAAALAFDVVKIAAAAAGKSIAIKDDPNKPAKRKIKIQVKDPGFLPPGPGTTGDPTLTGATVEIRNPASGEQMSVSFPPINWKGAGKPPGVKGYAYKVKGDPCSLSMKSGAWQLACAGPSITYTLDEPSQGAILVKLTLGTESSCVRFGGTVAKDLPNAGKKGGVFQAKNAPAPATCN